MLGWGCCSYSRRRWGKKLCDIPGDSYFLCVISFQNRTHVLTHLMSFNLCNAMLPRRKKMLGATATAACKKCGVWLYRNERTPAGFSDVANAT